MKILKGVFWVQNESSNDSVCDAQDTDNHFDLLSVYTHALGMRVNRT